MTSSEKKGLDPNKKAKILDIRKICEGRRIILIGDPHGCMDEVVDLLVLVKWDPEKDILIFVGDLVDRGPKIMELLNFVRTTRNVYTVLGNHDDKFMRWLMGRPVSANTLEETINQLNEMFDPEEEKKNLLPWLESLPHVIRFRDDAYAVHAGIDPRYPVQDQSKNMCMRIRTFDPKGVGGISNQEDKFWYEYYGKDPFAPMIFFGHNVHNPGEPYAFLGNRAVALDAGCVFGGSLRAAVLEQGKMEFVETPPKRAYYTRDRRNESG